MFNRIAASTSEQNISKYCRRSRASQRRRLRAAQRHTQVWRLRLGLIGTLILLIILTVLSYHNTDSMVQRQKTLNAAYRSHILFTDLDNTVRRTHVAAVAYTEEGKNAQRSAYQKADGESRKLLLALSNRSAAPWDSARERRTDIIPRTQIYLDSLEKTVDLRSAGRPQLALASLSATTSSFNTLSQTSLRLRAEEEGQLNNFTEAMTDEADLARNRAWLSTSLLLTLLGIAGLFLSRDLSARTRQERELRRANRMLTRLAAQDSLTQLKNRRAFEEELHTEWVYARRHHTPLSLLFVDVDKFKEYNDTFGHQAGDEALKQVAGLLRKEETLSGCRVARYGGEEFALILHDTGKEAASQVGERVRASFETVSWQGRPVTASVGVATIFQEMRGRFSDVETLLYEADGALYHAKREGRNRVAHADDLFPLPSASAPAIKTPVR